MKKEDEGMMFKYVANNMELTMKLDPHGDVYQYIDDFESFLLAVGFHPDSVKEALRNEFPETEEKD